jgi:ABC-type phosphate transport system permease subunit
MLVDIAFVAIVIGILIAIYKTKFAKKKTTEELKSELLREE